MSLQSFALLKKFVRRGELTVTDHAGERHTFGTADPRAAIRLNASSVVRLFVYGPVSIGSDSSRTHSAMDPS